METVAAFQASFCSLSPNWTVRSGSSRSDLRVGSRPVLSNAWIQVTIFSLAVGLTEKIEVYLRMIYIIDTVVLLLGLLDFGQGFAV